MSCTNCSSNPNSFNVQYFVTQCTSCSSSCPTSPIPSQCLYYAGPNLSCSGIQTNDSLEIAIQKIDEQICSVIGDYSAYQFHCLTEWFGEAIIQESQFVDAITGYTCALNDTVDTFINTTFVNYQTTINEQFDDINKPSITCTSASVTNTDSLRTVLNKYCNKFAAIDTFNSLTGVTWNSCYTVVSTPTTLATAFNVLLDQICQTKALASGGTLPTFNNTGSCLSGGGASDSLVTTIGLIKTRLCLTQVYDATTITWGCVTASSTLQNSIQNIVNKVSTLSQNFATFNNTDFTQTATDPDDPCAGITISLATPLNQDRFVAATASDLTPGTLQDKLIEGTGITLDFSTPTQVTINSSGSADNFTVKADITDSSPDYLDNKLNGVADPSGITILTAYNAGTGKVDITPSITGNTLVEFILNILDTNSELKTQLCTLIASCPSPCTPPTNVQVVLVTTTTTTTTTTLP